MNTKKLLSIIICFVMIICFASCGNNKNHDEIMAKRDALVGEYLDDYSQRAMLNAEKDEKADDTLVITVSWGSSATETTKWTMHAVLSSDGTKLSYTDGVCKDCVFDGSGNVNETTVDDKMEGYFEVKDGKLYWTGASDDNCKDCVFSIYKE